MLRNRFHCLWSHVVGPGIRKEGMHRKLPHWTIKHDPRRASTSEGRSHLATTKQTRDHAWTKTLWLRLPTASFLEEDALHVCTKGLTSDSTCVNATSASPPMVAMLLLWLSALLPVGTPGRVRKHRRDASDASGSNIFRPSPWAGSGGWYLHKPKSSRKQNAAADGTCASWCKAV